MSAVNSSPDRGDFSAQKPVIPTGVNEYFKPAEGDQTGGAYQPGLLLQAQVRYFSKQYGVNQIVRKASVLKFEPQGMPDWQTNITKDMDASQLLRTPQAGLKFASLPGFLATKKKMDDLQKDFIDWIYRQGSLTIFVNEELKLASIPGETKEAFIARCQQEAAKVGGAEDVKKKMEFEKKSLPLRQRIRDQQLKVEKCSHNP